MFYILCDYTPVALQCAAVPNVGSMHFVSRGKLFQVLFRVYLTDVTFVAQIIKTFKNDFVLVYCIVLPADALPRVHAVHLLAVGIIISYNCPIHSSH